MKESGNKDIALLFKQLCKPCEKQNILDLAYKKN